MDRSLDQLLDNDCLTPEQERAIRRLISYELVWNVHGFLELQYQIKINPKDSIYSFKKTINDKPFIIKKDPVYKDVMYNLILGTFNVNSKNKTLGNEVKTLFTTDKVFVNGEVTIRSKSQDLFDLLQRVQKDRANA